MAALDTFYIKTADAIRADYLRTYAAQLVAAGIATPNVSPGTEIYIKATALANQLAVVLSNTQLMADALMPDTALGSDLKRIASVYGLALRPAGGSSGGVTLASSASPVLMPTGAQLIDPAGLRYQVTIGGTPSNGDRVQISAIDTGSATNLAAGTVLKWVSPPPFVSSTAAVAAGGLTGGADTETIEGLRERLLARLQSPPGGGNASQLQSAAEGSTVAVQKAFVYPAFNGPGTVCVTVVGAPTSTSKNRDVDATTIATTVKPAVAAVMPEFVDLTVESVVNTPVDISIGMSLPASTSASPAGRGGGWIDGTPWPTNVAGGTNYADVTAVTSTTVFAVNADAAPTAGVTRICWLSPFDWKLYKATVTAVTGSGPWTITIDQPFVGIAIGQWICPQALNSATYFTAMLSFMATLGPGQKTALAGQLPRAYRQPLVSQSWPSDINTSMLKAMADSGDEVLDVSFLYRSSSAMAAPALITTAAGIFVPRKLGLYPTV